MICLFGGTFDPVHAGHVHAAGTVCDALALTKIHMLLSARPGHRDEPGASVEQRWRMLELACAENARLYPDDTEVRRARRLGRPSYAVETLEEYRHQTPDAVLVWVVGSDAYADLSTWYRWRDVFALCNLLVLRRPGAPLQLSGELDAITQARRLSAPPGQPAGGVLFLDAPMRDVSATRIRQALRAAAPAGDRFSDAVEDLLPPAVYTYIKQHQLYGVVSDA